MIVINDPDFENFFKNNKGIDKDDFQMDKEGNNFILYAHNVENNPNIIKALINYLTSQILMKSDTNSHEISDTQLENISIDINKLLKKKNEMIQNVTSFFKQHLKDIDEMNIDSINKLFSRSLSFDSELFICEICSKEFSNIKSLIFKY